MSIDQTTNPASARFHAKRPAVFITAGLVAAALAIGGPLAASAAPAVPAVTANTSTATASGQIALTASGFAPNESIAITLDTTAAQVYPEAVFTDGDGAFSDGPVSVYLPESILAGPHTITVTGEDSNVPVALPINVVAAPTLTISTTKLTASAIRSTGIKATARGFLAGQSVVFGVGGGSMGDDVATVTADADGTATYTYVFKAGGSFSTAGAYSFRASSTDNSVLSQSVSYTVVADPTAAAPATPVKATASFTG